MDRYRKAKIGPARAQLKFVYYTPCVIKKKAACEREIRIGHLEAVLEMTQKACSLCRTLITALLPLLGQGIRSGTSLPKLENG